MFIYLTLFIILQLKLYVHSLFVKFLKNFRHDIIEAYRCTLYNNRCIIILDATTHLILGGEIMEDNMTRWELLTLLLSIKGLLETDNTAKALEVIDNVIAEAKRNNQ